MDSASEKLFLDAVSAANDALGELEDRFPGFHVAAVVGIRDVKCAVLTNFESISETGGMFLWGANEMKKERNREQQEKKRVAN